MSKQPEALRLADSLEHDLLERNGSRLSMYMQEIADSSADELRSLHALNGGLLEALQEAYEALCVSYPLHSCDMDKRVVILGKARAAIAKAEAA